MSVRADLAAARREFNNIYIYIYLHIHIYKSIYLSIYPSIHPSIYLSIYICIHMSRKYVDMTCTCRVWIHLGRISYVCMYVCTYVCMYVRMYVCMFSHIEGVCDVNLPCTSDPYQTSVINPMYVQENPSLIHICSAFDTQIILTHCRHISGVYLTLTWCIPKDVPYVYIYICNYIRDANGLF